MIAKVSRREVIAGAGASAMTLSGPAFANPAATARGVVFEDRHGDGHHRRNAPGIPGVMVSNGRDVAVTAADGSWSLPVESGDSVFVIKPPDWGTRASPAGAPQFSYLHQPEGSPAYLGGRFPLVEPTGPLPQSVDFPLVRQQEPRDFDVALLSDTQPENHAELDYVRDDIIAAVLATGATFGINHGDVVSDDLSLYGRYLQILGATGIPWHHCPGNHDLNYQARDDRFSRETWKAVFGPRHYAFQQGNATFFMLDNVEYLGRQNGRYRGAFGRRQLDFVRNVLQHIPRDSLIVLSMHIPLVCYLDSANPADTTVDHRALLQLLQGRPHTVSFAGHLHSTEHHYLGSDAGFAGTDPHHHHVLTAASGSWWSGPADSRGIPSADSSDGSPNGFHLLSVSGNQYTTRFIPAAAKPRAQLRVVLDGPHRRRLAAGTGTTMLGLSVPESDLDQCRVMVNVFDGGPRTHVSCEIVGTLHALSMERTATLDPLIRDLFAGNAPRKSWVSAVASAHLWQYPLPRTLPPGAHVLQIIVSDEYGRKHVTRAVIEVTRGSGTSSASL